MADKKSEDRKRSGSSDDIMGISHGGGRDQYGGSFGGGQSAGGAYPNPHSGEGGDSGHSGGQSNQGYYGGGQMGDRDYGGTSHNAASTQGGPEHGDATYRGHASQHGGAVKDELSKAAGFDEHKGFGAEHRGQTAQGKDRAGPKVK